MLAWMEYATLVGALLVAAGALLEQFSPWLAGRKRLVWLTVIAGSLLLAIAVTVAPERSRVQPPLSAARTARPDERTVSTVMSSPLPASGAVATGARTSARAGAPQSLPFSTTSPSLDILLILVWFACSALCVAVLAVSAWRVARMRRVWRETVIAGVPVLVSHDVGPAVIGLVHHGIVVPAWVEALGEDEQRTVMTHEREHVRAGDPLLLWGATLLVALAPWNAALWYALRRLRHAIEMDCDARVLRSRPDTRAYCTLLLDVGERTLAGVAPVAALAEPATLLERRIDALTAPVRAWDRRVALGAMAALSLVGVACWTPRPEVAPRTRIAALVNELNSLLASDSAQRALSDAERDSVARVRERANAAQEPADSVHDDGTAPSRSSHVPAARRYGDRVDSLARAEYPRAFHTRDNAIVVVVLFDTADRIVRSYAKEFPREQVFDVLPGTTGLAQMRATSYLVARTVPLPTPRLLQSGGTNSYEAPNAIFVWVKVGSGPLPASEVGRDSPDTPQQAPDAAVASRNVDVMVAHGPPVHSRTRACVDGSTERCFASSDSPRHRWNREFAGGDPDEI